MIRIAVLSLLFISSLCPLCLCGESSDAVRLTTDGDFKEHLSWSPDGKHILMTRIHEGHMALWVMNADGSDLKPLVNPDPKTPHFDGSWSPDGKRIAFVLDIFNGTDGSLQIDTVNADGGDEKTVVPHKAFEESPRWSPDGKRIAWVSTRDGNQDIYTTDLEGKDVQPPHQRPGPRRQPELVAGRKEDRLLQRPRRPFADLRHGRRRRQRPPAHRPRRHRLLAGLVAGRQAASPSPPTATATTRSTSWTPTAPTSAT